MKNLVPRKFDRNRFLVDVNVRCPNSGSSFTANAIDLGQSGISLFSKRFIGVGESVEVEFKTGHAVNSAMACRVIGNIAYARVESDGNILGIAFSRALNPQELQNLRPAVRAAAR